MAEYPAETLARLVAALEANAIPYAIIGGVAVSLTSTPRHTLDVDAVIWVPERPIEELLAQLEEAGLTPRSADPIAFAKRHRMVLTRDIGGVEVDISLGALPFEETAVLGARRIELATGLSVRVASPESLVVMKAIASRPRDLEDIRQLLKMNPHLDRQWVAATVEEFAEVLDSPELAVRLSQLFAEIPAQSPGPEGLPL